MLNSDPKSPFTQNSIDFLAKYLSSLSPPNENCIQNNNYEIETADLILLDTVLKNILLPCTYLNTDFRINTCILIKKLFAELDDIGDDLFDLMKRALLDRCADKTSLVRASAIAALHRFQEVANVDDLVINAFKFHLKNDPDSEVRQGKLSKIALILIQYLFCSLFTINGAMQIHYW